LILFGIQNKTLGPYLAANNRILNSHPSPCYSRSRCHAVRDRRGRLAPVDGDICHTDASQNLNQVFRESKILAAALRATLFDATAQTFPRLFFALHVRAKVAAARAEDKGSGAATATATRQCQFRCLSPCSCTSQSRVLIKPARNGGAYGSRLSPLQTTACTARVACNARPPGLLHSDEEFTKKNTQPITQFTDAPNFRPTSSRHTASQRIEHVGNSSSAEVQIAVLDAYKTTKSCSATDAATHWAPSSTFIQRCPGEVGSQVTHLGPSPGS
jgi:hypothetical protein